MYMAYLSYREGQAGYFRIKRSSALQGHEHNLGIEADASWAMPAAARNEQSV